jgi:calcineurin-like phosphoesterase family protein
MYFFIADQHYSHDNIIRFCNHSFASVEEMDHEQIRRHNEAVSPSDTVIHAGDFAFRNARSPHSYLEELNGEHILVRGSHDRWLDDSARDILNLTIEGQPLIVCRYAMRRWPKFHCGSWQLFGHSHGVLESVGKQWGVGVDNSDFYPVSFDRLKEIMADRPDHSLPVTAP